MSPRPRRHGSPAMSRLSRPAGVGFAATVVLLAAGCGGDPNVDLPAPSLAPASSTNSTQGQLDASGVGGGNGGGSGSSSSAATLPGCNTDTDLADTDFASFGWTKKVMYSQHGGATIRDGHAFHFKIAENEFDACRPLSWIVLNGANGDLSEVAGTGASVAQAVVFFLGDKLVAKPMPVEVSKVEGVTRTASDAVTVRIGLATGTTAEGVTEHDTIEYAAEGGALVERSSTAPAGTLDGRMKLDFAAGPVPQDAEKTRLGNAHTG